MTVPAYPRGDVAPPLGAENPWPGPPAFRERDAFYFRGREAETAKLVRRIRRSRLTVLYGRSGLGKSSLLQAGAFPVLRQARFMPVYVRFRHDDAPDPMAQVTEALREASASAKPPIEAPPWHTGDSLWEHLHRTDAAYWSIDNRPVTPVFVFDQFEEAFTLGRRPARRAVTDAFFESLADLAEGKVPASLLTRLDARTSTTTEFTLDQHRYHVVISIREDFLAELKTLRPRIPSLLENDMRLAPMDGISALRVTEAGGSVIVPPTVGELIVRLVADAAEAVPLEELVVDPAILSLFLHRLNERRLSERQTSIDPTWVKGGRDQILSRFFADSVRDLGLLVRVFIEDRLLTRGGYRNSFPLDDALDEPGVSRDAIDKLIARRFLAADEWAGRTRLELTHDVLAGVVRRSRDERAEREEAMRKVAEAEAHAEEERQAAERRRVELELQARLDAEELRRQRAEVEREQADVQRRKAEAELAARRNEEEAGRIKQQDAEQRSIKLRARLTLLSAWIAVFAIASLLAIAVFAVRASRQATRAEQEADRARANETLAEERLQGLQAMVNADSAERQRILARYGISARRLSPEDSARAEAEQAARTALGDTGRTTPRAAGTRDSLGLKLWATGAMLRVRFLGGPQAIRAKVRRYAQDWTRYANLRFVFCDSCDAEIRVGFSDPGSWSYVGSDALGIPPDEPTVNFGWLTSSTPENEARRIVLHEFGHVLGLVEEHTNPNAVIPWDTGAVYRYYTGTQGWTRDQVQNLIFRHQRLGAYRPFDPKSVMMFPIPSGLTGGRLVVGSNDSLSASDKALAAQLYPRADAGSPPRDTSGGATRPGTDSNAISTVQPSPEDRGMFGSRILDVAIGLALIFLMLSLIASGVREAVEAIVKSRAVELERGIRSLLDDRDGTGMARALYQHPLVYSLYPGTYEPAAKRFRGRMLPDYIPARNFAVALLDMATRGPNVGVYAAQQTSPVLTIPALRASVQRIPSTFVQRALLSAIDSAHGDIARVQTNVEAWYDSAMDRVSGQYKRRTQFWLFVIGLGTTLALNVNTITIADYLAHNEAARAALVRRAQEIRRDTLYQRLVADSATIDRATTRAVYEDLQSLKLPIGWDRQLPMPPNSTGGDVALFAIRHVVGLLLTAFAIMLGAPFWFDLLNKFMVIRSTVKPKEKSPEEGSEDRQPRGTKNDKLVPDDATAGRITVRSEVIETPSSTTARQPAELEMVTVEAPHTDHEWAEGDPREGIL